ncbi:MAG: recombinase family protein [Oscillospiraceae bacterium]|nr:recombinase family protein [Oscillospiraceae bacterium]
MAQILRPQREELGTIWERAHPGDCVQVDALSSVFDSVEEVLAFAARLDAAQVGFRSLAEGVDTTGGQGDLFFRLCAGLGALGPAPERRRAGIEKAKEEGRYKGRKPIQVDGALFDAITARWEAGEISARETMRQLELKPNTFYRRVKERKEDKMKEIKEAGREIRSELREEARKSREELSALRRQVREEAREVKKAAGERLDAHEVEREIRRSRAQAEAERHDEVRQMHRTVAEEARAMKELLEETRQDG